MRDQFKDAIIDQKRKYIDTYLRWREAHKTYVKKEESYKNNLVDYEKLSTDKDVVIKYKKKQPKIFHTSSSIGLLTYPLRTGKRRPTCASFAAVYAIEVKRMQKGLKNPFKRAIFLLGE